MEDKVAHNMIIDSLVRDEDIQSDFSDSETGSDEENEFLDFTPSQKKVVECPNKSRELFGDGEAAKVKEIKLKSNTSGYDDNVQCEQLGKCKSNTSDLAKTEVFESILKPKSEALLESIEGETHIGSEIEDATDSFVCGDIPNGIDEPIYNIGILNIEKKKLEISQALEHDDMDSLKRAAIYKSGLLSDDIRKKAWPKLVGLDLLDKIPLPTIQEIEAHPYYRQVVLDVNRSLKRFPPSIKEAQRLTMLDQLVVLIMRVLCRHPEMHYYQGYHDICVTFLLVLGEETAFHILEKLSITHLNVFMNKSMEPTIHILEHMYALIGSKSPQLEKFLLKSEVGVAYCLSWLITWFGHVLNNYDNVVRLFDFFIVSHPYMPIYLTATVVLYRETEVLKQDCEMASVHSFLANIPDNLPFEKLIFNAIILMENYPPKLLDERNPYVPKSTLKPRGKFSFYSSIIKRIKAVVPASNITLPIAIAVGVLVTSYLYQAYKY